MNISQSGVNFIKQFEGLELHAYKPVPQEPFFTIGYGHYSSSVRSDETITEAQAEQILKDDLSTYVAGVTHLLKVPVNQNQFDALTSFAFNCGVEGLTKSNLLALVNKGDFIGASNEFGKWIHDGGKVVQGLINRRAAEKALFLKPVPVPAPPKPAPKPAAPQPVYHVVKSGETLTVIAENNSLTLAQVEALNKGINYNVLQVGQKIRIK